MNPFKNKINKHLKTLNLQKNILNSNYLILLFNKDISTETLKNILSSSFKHSITNIEKQVFTNFIKLNDIRLNSNSYKFPLYLNKFNTVEDLYSFIQKINTQPHLKNLNLPIIKDKNYIFINEFKPLQLTFMKSYFSIILILKLLLYKIFLFYFF